MHESDYNMKYGRFLCVKVILIYFLGLFLRPKPKKKRDWSWTVSVGAMILRDENVEKMNLRTANKLDDGPYLVDICMYAQ